MTVEINLEQVPNQNFQLVVEQDSYDITLLTITDLTYVSITRNNEVIISNTKAVPNKNILENLYQYNEHGNFLFTGEDDYPFYENFGVSNTFQYVTKAEVISGS